MCDPDGFEDKGIVLRKIGEERLLIKMPNGHLVIGVLPKKTKLELSGIRSNDKVAVFFSPADMSRGTIL
jgi:translation initiation factor IF-1